jgi:hypothetical protein
VAKKSRPTFQKREKERARQQKQKDKLVRRAEAKERRASTGPRGEGEHPDIAGIRPGPQPLPEQWDYVGNGRENGVGEATDDNL